MNSFSRYIRLTTAPAALLVLVLGAESCTTASPSGDGVPDPSGRTILIAAQAASQMESRAGEEDGQEQQQGRYVDSGPVKHGQFTLTYQHQSWKDNYGSKDGNSVAVGDVDFDSSVLAGSGIGITSSLTDWKEIAWRDVYEQNDSFYMDNVLKKYNSKYDAANHTNEHQWKDIVLKNAPFKAGLFDYKDGTNDLLWGFKRASRSENPIVMDLHHYMAIVRVEISVDQSHELLDEIDLTNAEIYITNLLHEPYSYNRKDGVLGFKPNLQDADYKELTMVNPLADEALDWVEEPSEKSGEGENSEKRYMVYTTKDFVLPPQGLRQDQKRPRLVIKVKDKEGNVTRSFSGPLPSAMWENPTESVNGTPMSL